MKTIRRPISILLAVLMVVGMFTVLPITASAAPPESGSSGSMETGTTITPSAAKWTFKLNSNFSGEWNADTDVVSEQPVELNLAEGDYEFQIVAYEDGNLSSYRGNVQAGSFTETYSQVMHDNGGNAKFHADGGKYTLTYNAGDGVLTINPVYVAEINGTNYKTLADAFAAAVDGDTIEVLADCAGNGIKVTPAGKFATGLTVNFNGHTYTVDGETVGSTGTETNGFQLLKNNKVTFTNGAITSAKAKILVQNYSDLTLDGMTLTLNNPNYTEGYTLSNNNGDVVINGSTINANPAGGFAFDVCRFSSYPSVNVTVKGNSQINGDVEISASKSVAKDGFSLTLESGTMTGNIVLDQTAKNIIAATPEKAVITKEAAFDKAAPADYKWDANGVLVPCDYVAKIGDTKYETLADAIAAAQDGDTITLMADVTEIATISGKTLTLDLYGFNITSTSKKAPVRAENGAKLTIVNSNTDKAENTATQNAIMGPTGSNNYGSVSATGEGTTVDIYAGYYYGYNGNKTAVNAINGATVTFWGGTVNGAAGINDTTAGKEGKVFYSGVSNPTKPYATSPGTIIVHGGNFSGRMSDSNWGNYVIDGGTFDRNEVVLNENPVDENGNRVATASSSMTSIGTGTLAEAGWLADGYTPVANGDGTYTVGGPYAAIIGDTGYATLEAAFAAAVDGDTITVLADSAGNGIKVPAGKFTNGLTVDFNGHTYTVNANTVGSTGTETQGFQLLKNNKITFTNGTINGDTTATETLLFLIQNYSDLTLDKMNLELVGKFYSQYTLSNNNGNIVINDSTINAPTYGGVVRHDVNSYAFDVCRFSSYPSVNVTVTGNSTINGDVEVSASKSDAKDGFSLNLNGGTMDGNIVLDASAETAMNTAPEKVSVKKAAGFDQEAPEGYMWVDTETEGVQTIAKAVAEIGETKYASLEAAFAAAADGDTITLLADSTGNGIKAPQGKFATNGLTVDFNGHTYTVNANTVGSTGTETNGFQLLKNNKITFTNGTITSTEAKILVQNYSNLTLDKMTLTLDKAGYTEAYTLSNNNGNVVIDDTTINANPAGGFAFDVCRYASYPSVNVTVTGDSKINGDVEIFASKGDAKQGFSLTLESGTMTGDIVLDASAETAMNTAPEKVSVKKASDFNQAAPEGYMWVDTETEGVQTIAKAVAKIGETKYASLGAAFAAVQDGETITLLANSTGGGIKVLKDKFPNGVTLDFAGYTYTIDSALVGSPGYESQAFHLEKGNTFTFKNGTITSENAKMLVQNYSDLTLDGMTLTPNNPTYTNYYTLSNNNGNIVIKDTTINANPTANSFAFDVCRYSSYPSVNVTVTGNSVINGDVEISASKGQAKDGFSLNLESGTMTGDIVVAPSAATAMAAAPEKASVNKQNTFEQDPAAGYKWKDNGDGTSTLVKADLFAGYGLTLQGDIGLIFYLDPAAMGIKADDVQSVSVSFTCDKYTGTVTDFERDDDYIKVAYYVPAAYMASPVHAYSVTINGVTSNEIDDYSVQQYALRVIADPSLITVSEERQPIAVKLMKEMLNYGAKAKNVFQTQMSAPEAAVYAPIPEYTMANVTATDIHNAISGTATDMSNVHPEEKAEFYTPSVIYLSKTTLRMYFKVPHGSEIPDEYDGSQSDWYYWVDAVNIAANDLHRQKYFEVNGVTFNYSVLDYAEAVMKSGMDQANKDLVSALYLYNRAAVDYFSI